MKKILLKKLEAHNILDKSLFLENFDMSQKSAVLLFVIGLLTIFGFAQGNREKMPDAAPTGLALEVTFIKTNPPAYDA